MNQIEGVVGRHSRGNLANEPIALLDANKVRSTLTNSSGDYKFVVTSEKIALPVIMTSVLDRFHLKTTNGFIHRRVYVSYVWYLDSDTFDRLTQEFHQTHQNKWDGASTAYLQIYHTTFNY